MRHLLCKLFKLTTQEDALSAYELGVTHGRAQAKLCFQPLPLPFDHDQLLGTDYGQFITPHGFGTEFGESMIPAPGRYGYPMSAGYVPTNRLTVDGVVRQGEADPMIPVYRPTGSMRDGHLDGTMVPVILVALR